MHYKSPIILLSLALGLTVSLAFTSAAADELPDLGDISSTVLTPLQEKAIAEQILREVATSDEVVQDAEVTDYIQALGHKLVEKGPDNRQKFTFFVVQDNTINAFAMPGGVIGTHWVDAGSQFRV
jgi:beta-barrel assembly-enhancing protease